MIVLEDAKISDAPELLPLMVQLGYPCSLDELEARYKKFTSNPGYGVVIVRENTEALGFLAYSRSDLLVLGKVRFHIEAIVVDNVHRGKGIGKKLMLYLEEVAKKTGPSVIDLTSGLRREKDGSHEFYKSLGYKNEGKMAKLYLRKEIG